MVVRLCTEDGKTWIYKTHQEKEGGEYKPSSYFTKCGLEWKKEPENYLTCDHIDCAIDAQRRFAGQNGLIILLILLYIICYFFESIKEREIITLLIVGIVILGGLFSILYLFKYDKKLRQLTEYNLRGTINGMSAYKDPSFDELIGLDQAAKCVHYGLFQHNKGKYGDAIRAFDKAIRLDLRFAAAWNKKGITLNALNRPDEAIAAFEMAIRLDPKLADAWHQKGLVLCDQNRYNEAIYAYDQAIKVKPKDADFLQSKGMALRTLGRNEEADKILKCARNEWNSKGVDLFNLGSYFDAIAAYDNALLIDSKFLYAWVNKGIALSKIGRYQEAIGAFNHAIEINPENPYAWNYKGLALQKIGRKSDADDAFVLARRLGI